MSLDSKVQEYYKAYATFYKAPCGEIPTGVGQWYESDDFTICIVYYSQTNRGKTYPSDLYVSKKWLIENDYEQYAAHWVNQSQQSLEMTKLLNLYR